MEERRNLCLKDINLPDPNRWTVGIIAINGVDISSPPNFRWSPPENSFYDVTEGSVKNYNLEDWHSARTRSSTFNLGDRKCHMRRNFSAISIYENIQWRHPPNSLSHTLHRVLVSPNKDWLRQTDFVQWVQPDKTGPGEIMFPADNFQMKLFRCKTAEKLYIVKILILDDSYLAVDIVQLDALSNPPGRQSSLLGRMLTI